MLPRPCAPLAPLEPARPLASPPSLPAVEADYPPSVQHLVGKQGISNLAGKQHMRIK